jgi:hypothetical protein
MKMSKIFLDWAIKKYSNDADLGRIFRQFYNLAATGGNTPEACRAAEEQIMGESFIKE